MWDKKRISSGEKEKAFKSVCVFVPATAYMIEALQQGTFFITHLIVKRNEPLMRVFFPENFFQCEK